jgi:hypothetical protein
LGNKNERKSMDNIINNSIIQKVTTKRLAIYKAIGMLPQPEFKDKFKKETLCQQNENTPKQSLEKCLNAIEPNKEKKVNDTTNDTKIVNEQENWRTITNPKLRKKMREKAYYKNNKEIIKKQATEYYINNKDKVKDYYESRKNTVLKQYNQVNKDRIKECNKNWCKINRKPKLSVTEREIRKLNYKLSNRLRQRLCKAIDGNYKAGSAVNDLGCTVEQLKQHLESKFSPGMSWDNWRIDGWHIDHIKPLASFDLTDRKQFLEACNYTNLQPLWATDNLRKGDNILEKQLENTTSK